jgi:hypothetical protein
MNPLVGTILMKSNNKIEGSDQIIFLCFSTIFLIR